jgi:hypothetical protein
VASLRAAAARSPHSRELHDRIREMCTVSAEFRRCWGGMWRVLSRHRDRDIPTLPDPLIGDVALAFEGIELPTPRRWR